MAKKVTKKGTSAKKTIKKYGDGGKNDATKDDFIKKFLSPQDFAAWRYGRGSNDGDLGYPGISSNPMAKAGSMFQRLVDAGRNAAKTVGIQRKGGKVKSKSTTIKKKK